MTGQTDNMPQVVKNTAELPKLTLTFTPEQAEAIAKAIKEIFDKAAKTFQQVVEAAKKVAEIAEKKAAKFIEAELYYANDNPRWWHLYKNAKKARTRKKYRRLHMNQLLSKLKAADPVQEVNT